MNGIATTVNPDRTWAANVPATVGKYVTPILAKYVAPGGAVWTQRTAVVNGPKLDEGQASPNGVGMRFTNTGLAGLGPVIKNLAAGAFDIGGLLLSQNPIINEENAFLTVDITGNAYRGRHRRCRHHRVEHVHRRRHAHRDSSDLYVGVNLHLTDGLLIDANCGLELQIPSTTIDAKFDLAPAAPIRASST